jgi:hypothetical protein
METKMITVLQAEGFSSTLGRAASLRRSDLVGTFFTSE